MAEIPVERKSSMAWLWILLAIIVALLLLWWLLDTDDSDESYVDPAAVETVQADTMILDGAEGANGAATAGSVTDLAALMPAIPQDMVGRQVQLNNVQVQEVVSDIGFWIGPSADQRVFAVLTQEPTPATPTEGIADVNSGAVANVTGTIRTRGEILENFAQGQVNDLPQGVDRFLVIENYEVVQ